MATPPEATLQLVHGSEKSQLVSPGGRAGSLTLNTRIGELDLSIEGNYHPSSRVAAEEWKPVALP